MPLPKQTGCARRNQQRLGPGGSRNRLSRDAAGRGHSHQCRLSLRSGVVWILQRRPLLRQGAVGGDLRVASPAGTGTLRACSVLLVLAIPHRLGLSLSSRPQWAGRSGRTGRFRASVAQRFKAAVTCLDLPANTRPPGLSGDSVRGSYGPERGHRPASLTGRVRVPLAARSMRSASGRPAPSITARVLVVKPPRDRPIARSPALSPR